MAFLMAAISIVCMIVLLAVIHQIWSVPGDSEDLSVPYSDRSGNTKSS